jgi:hypothetical protein
MRCRSLLVAAIALPLAFSLALPLLATEAQASWWGFRDGHTNDTGGIFPWSPDLVGHYHEIAASECARWNKVGVVTSVHAHYGDYVAFVCRWPRHYDPRREGSWGPYLGY